jgi:hypothetical protein
VSKVQEMAKRPGGSQMKILRQSVLFILMLLLYMPIMSCSGDSEIPLEDPYDPYIYIMNEGVNEMNLEFGSLGDATKYQIERSIDDDKNFQLLVTLGDSDYEYKDTGLIPGTRYLYRMIASNKNADSGYSPIDSDYTKFNGFGLEVTKMNSQYFDHPDSTCDFAFSSSTLNVPAARMLACFNNKSVVAPSTMTIGFKFIAEAQTCYSQPCFSVNTGVDTQNYCFDCNDSGNQSLVIGILNGQTVGDIYISLTDSDWAAWIGIVSVSFTP